jgi:maltose-6'-phosphate glucosidase
VKTWRNIKPIMDNFPEYLPNPYLQYYLMPNQIVEHQNPDYTRANEVMNGREKKLFAAAEEYKRTGILPDAFHVGVHGEFIVDVACSLAFNLRSRHLVMVENRGAITNLPYDAVVEVPAYITAEGRNRFASARCRCSIRPFCNSSSRLNSCWWRHYRRQL